MEMTGLSKSNLYKKIFEDEFPKPIRLGPRAVGWVHSEVQTWIEERIRESRS
jgi:prophage regulatory protein